MACPGLNKSRTCNQERCAAVGIPPLGQTKKFLNMTKFEPFVAPNHDDFCFQDQSTLGSYKYDYVSKNDPTGEKFGIFFTGDGRGEGSLRSKKSFRASDLKLKPNLTKIVAAQIIGLLYRQTSILHGIMSKSRGLSRLVGFATISSS